MDINASGGGSARAAAPLNGSTGGGNVRTYQLTVTDGVATVKTRKTGDVLNVSIDPDKKVEDDRWDLPLWVRF